MKSNFWDERFSQDEYIYGKEPNEYYRSKIDTLPVGKALFPAEGEGRNAVYAAKLGWEVYCFDTSKQGKLKAMQLAKESNVKLNYSIQNANTADFDVEFDAIIFVYNHFEITDELNPFTRLTKFLKKGGKVILEGFSKEQLEYQEKYHSGGPANYDLLFNKEILQKTFQNYEIYELEKKIVELREGNYHKGLASVIDLFASKK